MSLQILFKTPPGKPILRGREHFWKVIRALDVDGPWTITDVAERCEDGVAVSVRNFVQDLCAGGYVAATGDIRFEPRSRAPLWRIARQSARTPAVRSDGSRTAYGRAQAQMWAVLRGPIGRGGVTYQDLVLYGSTPDVPIRDSNAQGYLRSLSAAGYLATLKGRVGRQPTTYRLKPAMDTGPLPPAVLKTRVVFDRNRNQAIGPLVAVEEVAS